MTDQVADPIDDEVEPEPDPEAPAGAEAIGEVEALPADETAAAPPAARPLLARLGRVLPVAAGLARFSYRLAAVSTLAAAALVWVLATRVDGLLPATLLLVGAVLLVQVLAVAGALLMGKLAARYGAKRTVLASLVAWSGIAGVGYFLPAGVPVLFFVLAGGIGLVMGGSQALSRSLFSQLVPRGKEAEFFSLYEVSDRGTSWLGPLVFGLAYQLTESYRAAIISLVVFFVLGFVLLWRVPVERAAEAAGNPSPGRI